MQKNRRILEYPYKVEWMNIEFKSRERKELSLVKAEAIASLATEVNVIKN